MNRLTDHKQQRIYRLAAPRFSRAMNALNETMEALNAVADNVEHEPLSSECRALSVILSTYYELIQSVAPLHLVLNDLDHCPR